MGFAAESVGRPEVSVELRVLIKQMATANPYWGTPRIHGELLKLGIEISERTVSRLMPKNRKTPSQTWKAFLNNHLKELVSIDFSTVPTVSFRVLFVLVVLSHHRRRVVHFNFTEHPTAWWTGQQMVEAFPDATAPRYLLRDRDKIYGMDPWSFRGNLVTRWFLKAMEFWRPTRISVRYGVRINSLLLFLFRDRKV